MRDNQKLSIRCKGFQYKSASLKKFMSKQNKQQKINAWFIFDKRDIVLYYSI
jgi:hypothetical protein